MKNLAKTFLPLYLCVFAAACSSEQHDLRFQPGGPIHKSLRLTINGHANINIPIGKVDDDFSTVISTDIQYDSTAAGNTLAFQYQSFSEPKSAADTAMTGIRLSEGAENMSPIVALTRTRFTTFVNAAGKSGKVSGMDSLAAAFNHIIKTEMDNPNAVGGLLIDSVLKDEMLTSLIDLTQNVLPGKNVAIGDSWVHDNVFSPGFSLRMKNKYTLDRIVGDTAFITVVSGIDQPSPNQSIPQAGIAWFLPEAQKAAKAVPTSIWSVMAKNVQLDVKGTMDGQIAVDKNTGVLFNSKLNQTLEGSIKMSTLSIPVKLNITYNYQMQ